MSDRLGLRRRVSGARLTVRRIERESGEERRRGVELLRKAVLVL